MLVGRLPPGAWQSELDAGRDHRRPAVGRYAEVLRAPHVTPLLSMLAQLPYGVYALTAILYLAQARGSFESDEAVSRFNETMQAIPRRVGVEELTPSA
jgi:hypothetical protein